jgi:hypothetical protein
MICSAQWWAITEESNDYFATRYWTMKKGNDYFTAPYWTLKKVMIFSLLVTGL